MNLKGYWGNPVAFFGFRKVARSQIWQRRQKKDVILKDFDFAQSEDMNHSEEDNT
jgi:hypothetical protein